MKQILFFIFLSLSVSLNANEKSDKLADSLHSFGNNGEYAQMIQCTFSLSMKTITSRISFTH